MIEFLCVLCGLKVFHLLAYIGIGSNLGNKLENCRRAIDAIVADERNRLVRCSPFYRTEPVGKKDQDWFVNGVVQIDTSLDVFELLGFLLSIERDMGRIRSERWGPRIIDLDILLYGQEVIENETLRVPHPLFHERRFVLVPLKDIAPGLIHPRLEKTITQILAELKGEEKVLPLPDGVNGPCTV